MLEVVQATQEDVQAFHGRASDCSFRGIAVREDGLTIALAGVYNYAGKRVVFSDLKDSARKYRKSTLKIAKEYLSGLRGELYAVCSDTEPTAPRFLEHLGFYKVTDTIYRRD